MQLEIRMLSRWDTDLLLKSVEKSFIRFPSHLIKRLYNPNPDVLESMN